jgi:steroid delta-isomerase-like uncharacterized protein
MDTVRFDRLTCSLTDASSRRGLLSSLAATLGLSAIRFPEGAEADTSARTSVCFVKRQIGFEHGQWTAHPKESHMNDVSTIEANKAIARRWSEELWSQGKLEVADEIVAPTYVRHDPGDPFPAIGAADVKRLVSMLRAMLPDLTIEVEDMLAEGDKVVIRYTGVATDTVGFMGRPPTGKSIRAAAMQLFRFADGQIAESWAVRDDLGTLRPLGHLPPPAPRC